MAEKSFNVPGMSCGHCKAAVEDELNELPGVEKANADVAREPSRSPTTRVRWAPKISRVPSRKPATV
jgi:copper chaperone CopZ